MYDAINMEETVEQGHLSFYTQEKKCTKRLQRTQIVAKSKRMIRLHSPSGKDIRIIELTLPVSTKDDTMCVRWYRW